MYSLVGNDVFTDVEMFMCYDSKKSDNVINVFTNTLFTNSSKDVVRKWLTYPKYKISDLNEFQNTIKQLECSYEDHEIELNKLKIEIRRAEKYKDFFLNPPQKEIVSIFDFVYFKLPILVYLRFNKIGKLLTLNNLYSVVLSPIVSIMSPLLYVMIPYFILVFKLKIKIPIYMFLKVVYKSVVSFPVKTRTFIFTKLVSTIISLALYVHGVQTSISIAKNTHNVCNHLIKNINGLYLYISNCVKVCTLCKRSSDLPESLKRFLEIGSHTNLLNKGNKLAWYDSFSIHDIQSFSNRMDTIFAGISVVQVKKERNLCYTTFLDQSGTILEIKEGTHILIPNGVRNDIHLTNSGCMITGPNAAGKSTFLKSILLNILLSQSLGICCATMCNMTPFYFINSQINIPDTKGVESLFEAEMHRCKYNLDVIKELPEDRKSVVVMDELFNSTNVIEGISGAYAILSKLATFQNTMTLLTTHFPYLTKLKTFSRFKFDATILREKNTNGDNDVKDIHYNYKIQPGVSKQYIALDILKNKFDTDIIEIAQQIKKKLLV